MEALTGRLLSPSSKDISVPKKELHNTGSLCVARAAHQIVVLLLQPTEFWDYRSVPPYPDNTGILLGCVVLEDQLMFFWASAPPLRPRPSLLRTFRQSRTLQIAGSVSMTVQASMGTRAPVSRTHVRISSGCSRLPITPLPWSGRQGPCYPASSLARLTQLVSSGSTGDSCLSI